MSMCDHAPGTSGSIRCGAPASIFARSSMPGFARWVGLLSALSFCSMLAAADRHPALSPAEAVKNFQIEPGLRIELVAAEPLVVNPVAFVFDGPRRLFVAEGRGYPDA